MTNSAHFLSILTLGVLVVFSLIQTTRAIRYEQALPLILEFWREWNNYWATVEDNHKPPRLFMKYKKKWGKIAKNKFPISVNGTKVKKGPLLMVQEEARKMTRQFSELKEFQDLCGIYYSEDLGGGEKEKVELLVRFSLFISLRFAHTTPLCSHKRTFLGCGERTFHHTTSFPDPLALICLLSAHTPHRTTKIYSTYCRKKETQKVER